MNPSLTKKDYLLISIIGFLFGLLLLPILKNLEFDFFEFNFINIAAIVFGFAIFANVALFAAFLVGKKIPVVLQFAKFAAVGALNTLLDLGILNLLIYLSGFSAGIYFSLFKGCSFIIANINAYFWNRYWTFGAQGSANIREFIQHLTVSVVGFLINVGLASFVVNIIGPLGGISLERWANVGALSAVAASLVWNFIGYKIFVFKK